MARKKKINEIKKVLIIGGAGFIGINSARHFISHGYEVTILDDFSRRGTKSNVSWLKKDAPKSFKVVKADITRDRGVLNREVSSHDAVLHLAAQVAVTTSLTNPSDDFSINIIGTFNVLEAIRNSQNKPALLYSSTNKVYGCLYGRKVNELAKRYAFSDKNLDKYGVSESEQLDFYSPYGCSKGAADAYVKDYARIYGLRTVVFRQSCVYGRYQFGVEDQGWLAWFAIASMLKKPFVVYGTGKQVRDALYVDDLAELYRLTVENIDKVKGEVFNVGGGPKNTISLVELLDYLEIRFRKKLFPGRSDTRPGDQPIFVADVRKAKKMLGWRPKTGIKEGLGKMTGWIIKNRKSIVRELSK